MSAELELYAPRGMKISTIGMGIVRAALNEKRITIDMERGNRFAVSAYGNEEGFEEYIENQVQEINQELAESPRTSVFDLKIRKIYENSLTAEQELAKYNP